MEDPRNEVNKVGIHVLLQPKSCQIRHHPTSLPQAIGDFPWMPLLATSCITSMWLINSNLSKEIEGQS